MEMVKNRFTEVFYIGKTALKKNLEDFFQVFLHLSIFGLVLLFDYLNGVDIRSKGAEFLITPLIISPNNYNDYYELLDFDSLQPDFAQR